MKGPIHFTRFAVKQCQLHSRKSLRLTGCALEKYFKSDAGERT
jgi:hypothetical protein